LGCISVPSPREDGDGYQKEKHIADVHQEAAVELIRIK
jgi:hypothetical protein